MEAGPSARESDMANKAYWIARVDVSDPAGFQAYSDANPAIFAKFDGHFIVRSNRFDCVEGESRSRHVVVEFPDYASAVACYRSPEYQANVKARLPYSTVDLVIVEGCDGP